MTTDNWLGPVLRHERTITLVGLAALAALAWLYLVRLSGQMADMAAMGMAHMDRWTLADAGLATAMWAVMMVAMMLPTAAPMVLMFVNANGRALAERGVPYVDTGLFTLGYLAVWGFFSVVAATAQWGLREAALLSDQALAVTPLAGAAVLVGAGVWELTPLKRGCLARCQSPLGFLLSEWRTGRGGALAMGARYGLFCLGCCWALMALLFVGGVMNLAWVAAITAVVLVEKLIPAGRLVSWVAGLLLVVWGLLTVWVHL